MADTIDPQSQRGQHNRGPGVFIAGNVYGDVNNHQTSHPDRNLDDDCQPSQVHERNENVREEGDQPEESGEAGPGWALLGWIWLTISLFGTSGYCIVGALFTDRPSIGDRVAGVFVGVGSAFASVITLTFVFAALTEVCAAGTANAADSARKRWVQGQRAAARLNLRYAVAALRVASFSAVLAGFLAGLFGFLAIGKRAADRAHDARELAESEIAMTRSALGENLGAG
ncbi:hypothetical protein OG345_19010 [Streptomyces sp. NBC_01220]|uniref:hypothetical protein n=1 Tax=Streptomyces sp. NBC_01220 TaxID=2903781 RepID=UPI00352C8824|nr:hypothetical protein OG345_19010 [Streptomyces sp. NBC_01220]